MFDTHDTTDAARDASIDAFVELLLLRQDWQAALGAEIEDEKFVSLAVELTAAEQIVLQPAALQTALRQRQLPVERPDWPSPGWIPAMVSPGGPQDRVNIDWLWVGQGPIDAPFYEDVLRTFRSRPINRLVWIRTSTDTADKAADPVGLVYHMSRCGSTLVGRMLAANPEMIVLSEPSPLDATITMTSQPHVHAADAIRLIRKVVAALAGSSGRKLVIKLDAWHTRSMPLLRAAFPHTPWVFLFRDPVEVIVSHLKQPGLHTVPGLIDFNDEAEPDDKPESREIQIAKAIGAIGKSALEHWSLGGGIAVNYTSLRDDGIGRIMNHFGLKPDADTERSLSAVARMDAKSPDRPFVSDSDHKAAMASAAAREAASHYLAQSHEQLVALSMQKD